MQLGCSSVAGPVFSVRAWVLPISPKKWLRMLKRKPVSVGKSDSSGDKNMKLGGGGTHF